MTSPFAAQGLAPNIIPFSLGHPDPSTLLMPDLREAMKHVIDSPSAPDTLQYGPEQGTRGLIEFLCEKIAREQDCQVTPANLMIVAGSTHAVDMLTRIYAKAGGVVLVEAPTYADALHIFRDHHVELCPLAVDNDGLLPEAVEEHLIQLRGRGTFPSLLYTIPTFQNPTGRTLSTARRLAIIDLARRYHFLIVEDDVYRDLSFDLDPPPSFYALAGGSQVMSIGSFSKTLAPGLRVGWLLGSGENIQRCVNAGTTQMGGGANPFSAHLVAAYCRSGAWERHIQRIRTLYKTRRDRMLAALDRFMPSEVQWTHPAGGFFIWLQLPAQLTAQPIKQLAFQQGVAVASGEGFFVSPADGAHHLRLTYSCATLEEIDTGIDVLAQVIRGK